MAAPSFDPLMDGPHLRHRIEVDDVPMCSGPWDNTDGHYIHAQMRNYKTINPGSEVRAVITFAEV